MSFYFVITAVFVFSVLCCVFPTEGTEKMGGKIGPYQVHKAIYTDIDDIIMSANEFAEGIERKVTIKKD